MTEQMNVPILRFGEFDTEWSKQRLGQKMTIFRGASPRPKGDPRYYGGEIPRLMIQDATRDGKYTTPCIDFLTDEGAKKSRLLKAGSVVLSCSGTRVAIPTILAVDACVHDGWLAFKNYKDLESDFLYHLFVKLHERMQGSATTGGVFNNLTTEIMNNLLMSFPSVNEQQKIASFLSKFDEKIRLLSKKKEKLTEYKKGVMHQLFNANWHEQDGELIFTPPTLRFKADDGSKFPDWEEKRLGEVAKTTAGGTPQTTKPTYWGGEIPWMNSGELNLKKVYSTEKYITELGLKNSSTKWIPKDSILIGLAGQGKTRGTVAQNKISLCTNQSIASILPNEKYISDFLYYDLDRRYEALRKLSTGDGGRGGLNLSIINSLKLGFPCLAEQIQIANFLSAIDLKITLASSELDKAKEWKKGLLQQMFV